MTRKRRSKRGGTAGRYRVRGSSRREFLKRLGAGAAGLAGFGFLRGVARGSGRLSRPNILLIVNDEERHWSTVEPLVDAALLGDASDAAAGTFRGETPARMRLRHSGVRFTNYHTPTAPCSPARGTLYTGHHAPDNQVVDNMDFDAQASLDPEIPTLADVMGKAGYYCAYKGKVHLAKDADLRTADDMLDRYGFHDWQGPSRLGDSEGPLSGAMRDGTIAGYAADWLRDVAPGKNAAGQPWLLAINFINPHDIMLVDVDGNGQTQMPQGEGSSSFPLSQVPNREPYYFWWNPRKPVNFSGENGYSVDSSGPRPQILDEFASLLSALFGNIPLDDDATTLITVCRDNAHPGLGTRQIRVPLWQAYLNYYLNCIVDNDRAIATALDALVEQSFQDTTIVLFTADHGEMAMSHMGASRYADAAAAGEYREDAVQAEPTVMPLRQKGPFVYRENCQLPLVVANLSDRDDALVHAFVPVRDIDLPILASSVDILPTCTQWAGRPQRWYRRWFGRFAYRLGLHRELPGVSLRRPIAEPAGFQTPRWRHGRHGRDWVLFVSDAVSTLDADFAYLVAWDRCAGHQSDVSKRGMLRGIFDGKRKFVRYFSPLDYSLNTAAETGGGYAELIAAGVAGQDIQLFDLEADPNETHNLAAESDTVVRDLNQLLLEAMERELRFPARPPRTVQNILDGGQNPCS